MTDIDSQLEMVWQIYRQQFDSPNQTIKDWLGYIAEARGKLLRPRLLLLAGAATGPLSARHHIAAAITELVHTATLLHDDVIDKAHTRRHRPSFNNAFDNKTAIMTGDMMLARALILANQLQDFRINDYLAQTIEALCIGEISELANNRQLPSQTDYIAAVKNKTAALFSCCCWLGGYLSGADFPLCQRLADFGDKLGIAFQINDDIDDLCQCETIIGKTPGSDMAMGNFTLPFIYFLQALPQQTEWLNAMLQKNDKDSRLAIMQNLEQAGAIAKARQQVQQYANAALAALPPTHNWQYLQQFVNEIIIK
jgi:octaprenyl-diphosphate synthase